MCAWVTNYFSNIQLFATHWTAVRRSPLSMEFSRQEYWGGLPVLPSRVSSDPGMEPASLMSPALARSFFTTSATWESPLERMQSVSQSVSSVAQSSPTLCDPKNRTTPGFPIHHQHPSLPKPMSIELVMSFNHLVLHHPLLLLRSIFPSVRVFSSYFSGLQNHCRWWL